MSTRQFVSQLRERKIWRAAAAYPAAAFVFLEAIEFFVNNYGLNAKFLTVGLVLFLGALPIALVWNWCHGQPGPQAVGKREAWTYAFLTGATLVIAGYYWAVTPDDLQDTYADVGAVADTSIAILPFTTSDTSAELDYLCEGIAESLINILSSATELRVISRLSTFSLRDRIDQPREIGDLLKVGRLLSGHLELRGNDLIVRASLVDTRDGREVWGSRFVRPMSEILMLEDMIASDILAELRPELPAPTNRSTAIVDPMAYRHYLQGRFLSNGSTAEEIDLGLDHLREATRIDPGYAAAYAAIANALIVKAFFATSPAEEIVGEARTAAQSAIALDPKLADGYAALASIRMFFDFDWEGSEEAFQQAIAMRPTNSVAYYRYANLLTGLGRFDEAIAMAERAIDIDPIALGALHADGLARLFKGDFEEAVAVLGDAIEVRPEWIWGYLKKGLAHALLGERKQALALAAQAEEMAGGWGSAFIQGWLAWIYAVVGEDEALNRIRERVEAGIKDGRIEDPFGVAITYVALGNVPQALDWAEKTVSARSPDAVFWAVGTAPHLKLTPDAFREHPRFIELLERMNLPYSKP